MTSHRKSDHDAASLHERVREFEQHIIEKIHVPDTHAARKAAKREGLTELKFIAAWCGLWMLLVIATFLARGAGPPDETRLLGIAWERWAQPPFSVPVLTGEPEPHPPFFFWLIHLGWLGFGVTEWWARIVGPLGALASLFV